ncbi:MAG: class III extradiol ring-cleavage dioxygenase [Proteobacteria bacterium]|nr:class III extradiol ring-cleavage dioxygenase [Pseudomonadota bacterium]
MPVRMPVVFVSHGAPDALLKSADTVACWRELGRTIPQPSAILVVSAHWEAQQPTASLAENPETIHDFSGFSPALYRMQYPAPGAPALAEKVVALLSEAGISAGLHPDRGLDHGAWVPLSAMYPDASIPVTQLSLAANNGPAMHFKIGQALAPLRDEGVLIIASGSITHNFSWLDSHADSDQMPLPKAEIFTDWVADRLAANDFPALEGYRSAPYGAEAHPSEDHFLPLFAALGAATGDVPVRFQPRFTYGSLSMDAYLWQNGSQQT